METLKQIKTTTRHDVQSITDFLRGICDTQSGVPLALQMTASYINFKVQCLQACTAQHNTDPFEAFLGQGIHVRFAANIVTISRCSVLTAKNDSNKPTELIEEEGADIND